MPIDLTIEFSGGATRPPNEVKVLIESAIPGLEFTKSESGLERLRQMEEAGLSIPDVIRRNLEEEHSCFEGEVERENGSIYFSFPAEEECDQILVEVRGGDPMPDLIQRLIDAPGIVLIHSETGDQISTVD